MKEKSRVTVGSTSHASHRASTWDGYIESIRRDTIAKRKVREVREKVKTKRDPEYVKAKSKLPLWGFWTDILPFDFDESLDGVPPKGIDRARELDHVLAIHKSAGTGWRVFALIKYKDDGERTALARYIYGQLTKLCSEGKWDNIWGRAVVFESYDPRPWVNKKPLALTVANVPPDVLKHALKAPGSDNATVRESIKRFADAVDDQSIELYPKGSRGEWFNAARVISEAFSGDAEGRELFGRLSKCRDFPDGSDYVTRYEDAYSSSTEEKKAGGVKFGTLVAHAKERGADMARLRNVVNPPVAITLDLDPSGDPKEGLIIHPKGKGADSMSDRAMKVLFYITRIDKIRYDSRTKLCYRRSPTGAYMEKIHKDVLVGELAHLSVVELGNDPLHSGAPEFTNALSTQITRLKGVAREMATPTNEFNLANGVLVFGATDVTFRPHKATDEFTYILDYSYDPEAETPEFIKYVSRVLPDKVDVKSFFEYVGSSFIPKATMEIRRMMFMIGSGRNGKSTLINLVASLFGDAAAYFNFDKLASGSPDAGSVAFQLYGKQLGFSTDARRIRDMEQWKKLANREPISMWQMHVDRFESDNYPRLIVASNHLPNVEASASGSDRLLPIAFKVTLTDAEQDLSLGSKLRAERSGVLNLVIEGFRRIIAQRGVFTESETTVITRKKILSESNQVGRFMEELGLAFIPFEYDPTLGKGNATFEQRMAVCYAIFLKQVKGTKEKFPITGKIRVVSLSELYDQWKDWSENELEYKMGRQKFRRDLEKLPSGVAKVDSIFVNGVQYRNCYVMMEGKRGERLS